MKNRKGFTLIELLAVIIILAILMTLAITSMSGYIRNAEKDTFVTTAQEYVHAVRLHFVNNEYDQIAIGQCLAVPARNVDLESGDQKSSFGSAFTDNSYIVIKNVGNNGSDKYEYYVQLIDSNGNGFALTQDTKLSRQSVLLKTATADTIAASGITGGGSTTVNCSAAQGSNAVIMVSPTNPLTTN